MSSRTELHAELCEILGSKNVYFQPPVSIQMKFPAIVYEIEGIENVFSNNRVYLQKITYRVTLMDTNPDSDTRMKISRLTKSRFINHFTSDNIYHDVFRIIKEEKVNGNIQ